MTEHPSLRQPGFNPIKARHTAKIKRGTAYTPQMVMTD